MENQRPETVSWYNKCKENQRFERKTLHLQEARGCTNGTLDEMFCSLPLDPNNDWIKLSKFVPWREFDLKYADNFRSKKGQRACDSRMALGSVLIRIHYKGMSDEDLTKEIAMNPYLQYFLGLQEYRYECPFDASMMTRFRQRISAEMLAWVNDEIIGKRAAAEKKEEEHKDDDFGSTGNGAQEENKGGESEEENRGTLILSATCAPQNIRFPTDTSLLNVKRFIQTRPAHKCAVKCSHHSSM